MCPVKDEDKRPYGGSKATSRYFMAVRKIHNQGRAVNVPAVAGHPGPDRPEPAQAGPRGRPHPRLPRPGHRVAGPHGARGQGRRRRRRPEPAASRAWTRARWSSPPTASTSPPGQSSITVRTHYIDDDAAEAITDRAKALRDGVTTLHVIERGEERDPLADIAAVLGDTPRLRTQDVLKRLATLNEDAYGGWSFLDLKRVLDGRRRRALQVRRPHGRRPRPRRPRPRQPRRGRFRFRRRMTGSRPPTGQGGRENSLTPSLTRLPGPDLHK